MDLFSFSNHRDYIKAVVQTRQSQGRGEISRMASQLGIHSTLMSLIVSGKRELSQEQAFDLCAYLDLNEAETEYFLLLTQIGRSGTERLKKHLRAKAELMRQNSMKVASRVKTGRVLTESQKAVFYSSWIYSAIRLYCSTSPNGRGLEDIASRFDRTRPQTLEDLRFLLAAGLLSEHESLYRMETARTFLPFGSPLLGQHHRNWRLKGIEASERVTAEELMVTSPCSISREDFQRLKKMLLDFVRDASEVVRDTNPEGVACFNLDLFWVTEGVSR